MAQYAPSPAPSNRLQPVARTVQHPILQGNLDDLIGFINGNAALPASRRADMVSAIRSACRILNRLPRDVPTDPAGLNRLFADVAPAAHGLSRGRWSNIRNLIVTGKQIGRAHV